MTPKILTTIIIILSIFNCSISAYCLAPPSIGMISTNPGRRTFFKTIDETTDGIILIPSIKSGRAFARQYKTGDGGRDTFKVDQSYGVLIKADDFPGAVLETEDLTVCAGFGIKTVSNSGQVYYGIFHKSNSDGSSRQDLSEDIEWVFNFLMDAGFNWGKTTLFIRYRPDAYNGFYEASQRSDSAKIKLLESEIIDQFDNVYLCCRSQEEGSGGDHMYVDIDKDCIQLDDCEGKRPLKSINFKKLLEMTEIIKAMQRVEDLDISYYIKILEYIDPSNLTLVPPLDDEQKALFKSFIKKHFKVSNYILKIMKRKLKEFLRDIDISRQDQILRDIESLIAQLPSNRFLDIMNSIREIDPIIYAKLVDTFARKPEGRGLSLGVLSQGDIAVRFPYLLRELAKSGIDQNITVDAVKDHAVLKKKARGENIYELWVRIEGVGLKCFELIEGDCRVMKITARSLEKLQICTPVQIHSFGAQYGIREIIPQGTVLEAGWNNSYIQKSVDNLSFPISSDVMEDFARIRGALLAIDYFYGIKNSNSNELMVRKTNSGVQILPGGAPFSRANQFLPRFDDEDPKINYQIIYGIEALRFFALKLPKYEFSYRTILAMKQGFLDTAEKLLENIDKISELMQDTRFTGSYPVRMTISDLFSRYGGAGVLRSVQKTMTNSELLEIIERRIREEASNASIIFDDMLDEASLEAGRINSPDSFEVDLRNSELHMMDANVHPCDIRRHESRWSVPDAAEFRGWFEDDDARSTASSI